MSDLLTELAALADPRYGLARGFDDAQATLNAAIRELQVARKLIADLRAIRHRADESGSPLTAFASLVVRMIDEAGL